MRCLRKPSWTVEESRRNGLRAYLRMCMYLRAGQRRVGSWGNTVSQTHSLTGTCDAVSGQQQLVRRVDVSPISDDCGIWEISLQPLKPLHRNEEQLGSWRNGGPWVTTQDPRRILCYSTQTKKRVNDSPNRTPRDSNKRRKGHDYVSKDPS